MCNCRGAPRTRAPPLMIALQRNAVLDVARAVAGRAPRAVKAPVAARPAKTAKVAAAKTAKVAAAKTAKVAAAKTAKVAAAKTAKVAAAKTAKVAAAKTAKVAAAKTAKAPTKRPVPVVSVNGRLVTRAQLLAQKQLLAKHSNVA